MTTSGHLSSEDETHQKTADQVQKETAEVLGQAVAEVARRALQPELEPFKNQCRGISKELEAHVKDWGDEVRELTLAFTKAEKSTIELHGLAERLDGFSAELSIGLQLQREVVEKMSHLGNEQATLAEKLRNTDQHCLQLAQRVEGIPGQLEQAVERSADIQAQLSKRLESILLDFTTEISSQAEGTRKHYEAVRIELERKLESALASQAESAKKVDAFGKEMDQKLDLLRAPLEHGGGFRLALANLVLLLLATGMAATALVMAMSKVSV